MRTPIIQLLLATYNDGRFLDDFFESILSQTEPRWCILARDDGSVDGTLERLVRWRETLDGRLVLLSNEGGANLGIAGNFSCLLASSTCPYVMFANPDDVWHADKIAVTLEAMQLAEADAEVRHPCLVHTDLRIVDAQRRQIAASLWEHQGLVPNRGHALPGVMVENIVWACTAMLNRPLADLAGEVPRESYHEDWWVAMVAAAFGRIISVPVATIDWRRHGANASTVSGLSIATNAALSSPGAIRGRLRELFGSSQPRVRVFLQRYRERLSPSQIAAAEAFLELQTLNFLRRRMTVIRHRLWFTGLRRNLALLLFV